MASPLARKAIATTHAPQFAASNLMKTGGPMAAPGPSAQPYKKDLNIRLSCRECYPRLLALNQANDAARERARKKGDMEAFGRVPENEEYVPNVVEETANGDLVCGDCGLVLGDRVVDTRSEWRTFASDDGPDQSRVGEAAIGLDGREDLSLTISFKDGHKGIAKTLQRTQRAAVGSRTEETITEGFRQISELSQNMNLTKSLTDSAKILYMMVSESRKEKRYPSLKMPKDGPALVAACVFMAAKQPGESARHVKELTQQVRIGKKDLWECIKNVGAIYKAEQAANGEFSASASSAPAPRSDNRAATELLPRYCQVLGVRHKIENCARECIDKCSTIPGGHRIDGRSPISIAAGAIWFSCQIFGQQISSRDIMEVAQVSESTIRLLGRIFNSLKDDLIDEEMEKRGADKSRIPNIA